MDNIIAHTHEPVSAKAPRALLSLPNELLHGIAILLPDAKTFFSFSHTNHRLNQIGYCPYTLNKFLSQQYLLHDTGPQYGPSSESCSKPTSATSLFGLVVDILVGDSEMMSLNNAYCSAMAYPPTATSAFRMCMLLYNRCGSDIYRRLEVDIPDAPAKRWLQRIGDISALQLKTETRALARVWLVKLLVEGVRQTQPEKQKFDVTRISKDSDGGHWSTVTNGSAARVYVALSYHNEKKNPSTSREWKLHRWVETLKWEPIWAHNNTVLETEDGELASSPAPERVICTCASENCCVWRKQDYQGGTRS
ncbi:hypothetical protein BJ508DRAFT_325741 [Ascobolus immersus RN42]|uniref:F-box domain-containing protein n=1 Tax=Ascobolus immersus RN42 TaxID=1160509 RepID=A0A3N4I816_ASCIM|nr:hypothetical protein BJ508DRAFT_325741 [Ascobolus immersus RN42]